MKKESWGFFLLFLFVVYHVYNEGFDYYSLYLATQNDNIFWNQFVLQNVNGDYCANCNIVETEL